MEAAEIAGILASPPMTYCAAHAKPFGTWLPSTSTCCGGFCKPSQARRMASMVAPRILSWSISATLALAMHQARARSRISTANASRRAALRRLESFRPSIGLVSSRITAAANTGPARGPRPASSTPAHNTVGIGIPSNRLVCMPASDADDGFSHQTWCIQVQAAMYLAEALLDVSRIGLVDQRAPGGIG